jgi:predicted GNAT family acetyltransferase
MIAGRDTELTCECDTTPIKMTNDYASELKELYRECGTPAWTASALELGPFYGIIKDEAVVSVAGVHYVTPHGTEIGNVATHPNHRRKGYAEACMKAVVDEVLEESSCAILHYFADNKPAQRLYERMGFEYSPVDPVYFVKARL